MCQNIELNFCSSLRIACFLMMLLSDEVFARRTLIHPDPELVKMHETANSSRSTDGYVHTWLPMPPLVGRDVFGKEFKLKHEKGYVYVLYFISSWCLACQEIIEDLKSLEKKFSKNAFRFLYIFSHDTSNDVKGFMKSYGIDYAYLSSHEILREYHNPPLPTVYIMDRDGWLTARFQRVDHKNVGKVKSFIEALGDF